MANPVTKIRNTAADYRKLDGRDKRRFWTDGILNNALYILMAIFIIYTAIVNHNFLKIGPSRTSSRWPLRPFRSRSALRAASS